MAKLKYLYHKILICLNLLKQVNMDCLSIGSQSKNIVAIGFVDNSTIPTQ